MSVDVTVPATPLAELPAIVAETRATFDSGVTLPIAWRRAQVRTRRAPGPTGRF